MSETNRRLAALFRQMAEVNEILDGDRFRTNAFAKAARVLEDLADDVAAIGPDLKKLTAIDGIGKGTAERVIEFLQTGRIKDHDQLLARIPPGLPELLEIPGLGPKTVALLWNQGGVTSKDELKRNLAADELAKLPGMGAKKLENLRRNLEFAQAAAQRVRLGQALPLALWLVDKLRKIKGVKQATYAGSLRRGKETIGDVDLLVSADEADAAAISDAFVKMEPVSDVLAKGRTKTSVRVGKVEDGATLQVDLRIVPPASYGAALMYFTGSKEHNVALRERAIKRGMKLNEYGLFKGAGDGEPPVAGESEAAVYEALELSPIPPELREDRDEIELAQRDALPELIALADIKAELHAHTTASDGKWSIRELASAAAERGFHTVAVTDHSKGQVQANGLNEERLERHIEQVRKVAAELKGTILVLAGTEVDIHADGSLDYPNSLLKEPDLVVASPHSALSQDPAKATHRLLRAIEHPHVTIIGHATGRLINRREGLHPDMKELFKAAARRDVALEINANNWRLDLRDSHARAAIEAGVKLSINTDAHGPSDLDQLIYGVLTARRAGARRQDVINCLSRDVLAKWVKARRGG